MKKEEGIRFSDALLLRQYAWPGHGMPAMQSDQNPIPIPIPMPIPMPMPMHGIMGLAKQGGG
jgi:hypothetical protein